MCFATVDRWSLREVRWTSWRILGFQFPGRRYAVLLFWDPATDDFAGYYVNVHTSDFSDGAVRGQLA